MKANLLKSISLLLFLGNVFLATAKDPVRLKDIATIQGIKENQLTGIGLVTGLKGQGDSQYFKLTSKMLYNLAANNGFEIDESDIKSKNIAAVIVTARIGGFTRIGDTVDVTVSSIGDSKSLEGGVLLQTALKAGNDTVYAVAQGRIITGTKGNSTEATGSIPSGAIVEKESVSSFLKENTLRIILRNPDFTTANAVKTAISDMNPDIKSSAIDAGIIEVVLTAEATQDPVNFISQLEALTITPDYTAAVVIDKKTGVIISGGDVVIQECTVSTKSLSLSVNKSKSSKNDKKPNIKVKAATVDELVSVLNQAGISQDEIIALLEAVHRTGGLNARLIVL